MNTTHKNPARVAVVTGHSHGLGRAVALALLAQGWAVLGVSRSGWPEAEAAAHPGLTQVALDLADSTALGAWLASPAWAQALAGAETVWLVNNAGTVQPMGPAGAQGPLAVAQAVALNVAAPLMLADALIASTAACTAAEGAQGVERRVVHVSSGAARNPYAGWSVYGATKAALDMHARATQLDGVAGLRIESLAPGVVDTAMQAHIRGTGADRFPHVARFQALHAQGALASPTEVAVRLLAHMGSDAFGQQAVRDLRELRDLGA
ncbi:Rossmann-fold NAD(P)-binding domain-containing protein [Hydrogenophaga soli]